MFPFRQSCPFAQPRHVWRAPATRSSLPTVCWTLQSAHWVECQLALEWLRLDHWFIMVHIFEDKVWRLKINWPISPNITVFQVYGDRTRVTPEDDFVTSFFRASISIPRVRSCFDILSFSSFSQLITLYTCLQQPIDMLVITLRAFITSSLVFWVSSKHGGLHCIDIIGKFMAVWHSWDLLAI